MERPTIERGESLDAFEARWQAWIESWDLADALGWLDEQVDEGPAETRTAHVLRTELDRLRAIEARARTMAAGSRVLGYQSAARDILGEAQ